MIGVVHEAKLKHERVEALHRLADNGQKVATILIVFKDRYAPVTARGDVADRAGKFKSQGRACSW